MNMITQTIIHCLNMQQPVNKIMVTAGIAI